MTTIKVATAFSRFPAGRYYADGPFPGQKFREEQLVPKLKAGPVTVDLDGLFGHGSSFLEETFGGLVRMHGFTEAELKERLHIITRDPSLEKEIWGYVRDAKPNGG